MKKRVSTALMCFLLAAAVSAQDKTVDVGARAQEAAHVVVATVVDISSRFGTNTFGDRLIYSDVVAEVSETLKGPHDDVVTVTVEGGAVGELVLKVSDMPVMHVGERALYFLDRTARGEWVPHRRGYGILKLDAGERVEKSQLTLAQARQLIRRALR